jgi:hypothetical protein
LRKFRQVDGLPLQEPRVKLIEEEGRASVGFDQADLDPGKLAFTTKVRPDIAD